jgi:ribonuclease E
MSRIMFIDGSHREQIRVAVTEKGRVTEFDIESFDKKQTIGNIYLAKVTRIEPSLQAAFVEYGSGRQGFLSFSEIHPDYYQIPLEDRKRLLDEAAAFYNNQNDDDIDDIIDDVIHDVITQGDSKNLGNIDDNIDSYSIRNDDLTIDSDDLMTSDLTQEDEKLSDETDAEAVNNPKKVTTKKTRLPRYKIQEVIKKRQILLVQVIKSERGNKGAALTTYLSLAGRYCVLMPNTARGGGISRKITNIAARQKLRSTIKEFEVPSGMGLIIRTAGLQRTKAELRRDYEYLLRLWDNVRQLTMSSIAPALVYEEGDLIKRALRDIYTRDTSKVLVQGEAVYKEARDIMKMIMPSVVRFMHHYHDPLPLFSRYQIERQLDELSLSQVTLKSGGYLVINHTEALIAIDVNSGKSTNSYSVEETALRTNLEAAEEIARQLRLRDLAGLIVIDFIDMEDSGNVRTVERKMRDFLKSDKARLQIAPISMFGLMEMTRQRLRPAMKDLMAVPCEHCQGMGFVPSLETSALRILRAIFEEIAQKPVADVTLTCSIDIAHYLLNKKRKELWAVEAEYELIINIQGSSKCAHLEYNIDIILKDPTQISRTPKPYQEDAYEAQIYSEDSNTISDLTEETPKEDNLLSEPRGRNNKRRRSHKHTEKEEISHNISDEKVDTLPYKSGDNRYDSALQDTKRSKFNKKRSRYSDRFKPEADVYITASGNHVVIENTMSVRHFVEDNLVYQDDSLEYTHKENNQENMIIHSENTMDNVIIENSITVKSMQKQNAIQALPDVDDDVLTKIDDMVHDVTPITSFVYGTDLQSHDTIDTSEIMSQSQENTHNTLTEVEEQKPARRGWWRNRFKL